MSEQPEHRGNLLGTLALGLLGLAAACSAGREVPADGGAPVIDVRPVGRDVGLPDAPGTPTGCTWDALVGCWSCCPKLDFLGIGCRKPGDCALFCSRSCMPPGYSECPTWDPQPSGDCAGFDPSHNRPFERCVQTSTGCYGCRFCFGAGQAVTYLVNPQTKQCTCFADSCAPDWLPCPLDAGP